VAAFTVNGYCQRDEDVYVSYGLPGRQVARFAMRDDQTMFLFVFADAKGRCLEQPGIDHKDILRAEFGEAGWECPQILEAMESCGEIYFDRVSQIRMGSWSLGRVSLVGDAALLPLASGWPGLSISDVLGLCLAGELRRADQPRKAFQRYEQS
jgi:2-polyprenyl-6-methoxyphenol hydroxylase-like FAD-dependent oxidoreductase